MIISNQIECLRCGDRPFSAHRHDYRTCKCRSVGVDGGTAYLKRVGKPELMKELSIDMPEEVVDAIVAEATWAVESNRNPRGIAYAVVRGLRDSGVNMTYRIKPSRDEYGPKGGDDEC